jgi:hypothetical protein
VRNAVSDPPDSSTCFSFFYGLLTKPCAALAGEGMGRWRCAEASQRCRRACGWCGAL